jgi:imidazolonepropionase-like amidohydrolase
MRAALYSLALLLAAAPAAERPNPPRVFALRGATVVASPGKSIANATVLLRDGRIEALGNSVALPPDAAEIDLKGKWVYPGFVDPDARAQVLAATSPATPPPETAGPLHPLPGIRPERRALDGLLAWSGDRRRDAEAWRAAGYTAIALAPSRGVLRGSSVLVQVHDDRTVREIVLREEAAQAAAFEAAAFGRAYPTSVMGAAAALRQTLLDAQRQRIWETRWAENPVGIARQEHAAAFDALAPVLARQVPLLLELQDPADLELADRIAREFDLDLVVSGTGHEWEVAEAAAASGRTVVLPLAFPDKPDLEEEDTGLDVSLRTLRRYVDAAAGPGRLHAAGVPLAFTTRGLKALADVLPNLRKIVAAGLPEEAALAALTTEPARIVGAERILGSLAPGKIANLLVCDGPLLGEKTRVVSAWVDGVEYKVPEKARPKGDPSAVVDPRGTWSVVLELGRGTTARTWTITGQKGAYAGTAETSSGLRSFDTITLEGNLLTVRFTTGMGAVDAVVVIEGDAFEGTAEAGTHSGKVRGTRTGPPEGGP